MSREDMIDWFHGELSREEAEKVLQEESAESQTTDGIFLVRESKNHRNNYVLSVIYMHEFYHYQIQRHGDDAFFSIDSTSIHHGLDQLIEYYKNNDSNLCTRLDKYVKKGPPPTKFCRFGKANLLHRATKFNNLEIVQGLLTSSYAGLDAKDENGMTAVHLAPINKVNPEIMKMLIEKGAALMSHDSIGNTALHYACSNECTEMVELLVNANKNLIHTRNNTTGMVPLHEAARVGNLEIVKFLLSNKAASMSRTLEGLFPSDLARENHHIEVAEYLEKFLPPITTFSHKWHHGTLDREGARTLLLQKRNELYEKFKDEYPQTENVYVNDNKEINDLISGLFLVRSSERNNGLDVITMLHDNDLKNIRNYVVQKSGKYVYIDDGPYLPSLEHLISYYMTFPDGLPVKLTRIVEPLPKPPIPIPTTMSRKEKKKPNPDTPIKTPEKSIESNIPAESPSKSSKSSILTLFKKKKNSLPAVMPRDDRPGESTTIVENFNKSLSFSTDFLNNNSSGSQLGLSTDSYDIPPKRQSQDPTYFTESDRDCQPDVNDNCIEEIYFRERPKSFEMSPEWNQLQPELYDTQKNLLKEATSANYYVSNEDLKKEKEIGSGEFGNVMRGQLRLADGRKIWVAIKTLHRERYEENYAEFLKEASVMIKLDNPYIVKLIGITKGPPIGLVQELLTLGSLENYLKKYADEIDNKDIDKWASQIAQGMEYLESKRFVHRDLATRNILLAAKDHCKISDFGLSRALGADMDCYQAVVGGRWPIRWFAPESFYGKFSHASDVWSFGVTLWELYTRGQTPYKDMNQNQVIEFIDSGERLPKPDQCPNKVFKLMTDGCWHYRDRLRPNFKYLSYFFLSRLESPGDDDDEDYKADDENDDKHSNTVYV